jgi:hypothetical protein
MTTQAERRPTGAAGRLALLVAGDALAFLAFAAIGRASHSEAAGIDALAQIAYTAAPFAAGWFLAAPWAGAFRATLYGRPQALAARTALAWLIACPIGLVLRALLLQREIPLSFAVVTFLSVLAIMLVWRTLFALAIRNR